MSVLEHDYEDTPILSQLERHVRKSEVPLHVPGHKQGRLLPSQLSKWLGAAAKLDLTELPGLDNLQQPHGCIALSQQLTAEYYGSKACLYSVNGSTACVMAALAGCAKEGSRILFLNPFHQSAWRGLVLAGAVPQFVPAAFDQTLCTFLPPAVRLVEATLQRDHDFAAVYLTSPTYMGLVSDVEAVAAVVHRYGLPLIVDEAHGAHFGLIPEFPNHSVRAGADIVIQSVHKMLPGLTQTAWVHCQGDIVNVDNVAEALRMLQSTSPSYLLMASIDAAQAWLRTQGPIAARLAFDNLQPLREFAAGPSTLAYFSDLKDIQVDPMRHWVPTGNPEAGRQLQNIFEKRGIFVEYADSLGVLSIFGLSAPKRDVERYIAGLAEWETTRVPGAEAFGTLRQLLESAAQPTLAMPPRLAAQKPKKFVPLTSSIGKMAGELITPYPPGVPVVWPGQVVTTEVRDALLQLSQWGAELHGLRQGMVAVLN